MTRFAAAFAFVVLPFMALAAPVPPPSEKELLAKHWGKTEGEGEFELKGKQLTIRSVVPPSNGLIGIINGGRVTMPRTTRTIAGDFEMTVKVMDSALPNKDAKHSGSWPATRAGLFIEGGGYGIELHLYQAYSKVGNVPREEATRYVWVDAWFPRGGSGSQLKNAEAGKSTYLRIIRKEKTVSVSYSFDGKDWSTPYSPRAMEFPDEVTVGVFFSHTTYQILDATFDGFTIDKPKAKEKDKK